MPKSKIIFILLFIFTLLLLTAHFYLNINYFHFTDSRVTSTIDKQEEQVSIFEKISNEQPTSLYEENPLDEVVESYVQKYYEAFSSYNEQESEEKMKEFDFQVELGEDVYKVVSVDTEKNLIKAVILGNSTVIGLLSEIDLVNKCSWNNYVYVVLNDDIKSDFSDPVFLNNLQSGDLVVTVCKEGVCSSEPSMCLIYR